MIYCKKTLINRSWYVDGAIVDYFHILESVIMNIVFMDQILRINKLFAMNNATLILDQLKQKQALSLDKYQQKYKTLIQEHHQNIHFCNNSKLRTKLLSQLIECIAESGHLYYLHGEYLLAKKQYEKTIRKDPEHISALIQLGMCLKKEKLYDEAVEVFKSCIDRSYTDSDHVHALINIARIYQLQKKTVNSIAEVLMRAKKISPKDVDIINEEKRLRKFIPLLDQRKTISFFHASRNQAQNIIIDAKIVEAQNTLAST